MYKFLETYSIPRLNHEEIENLNSSISSNEIESEISQTNKKTPKKPNKQKFRARQLHRGITKHLKQRTLPNVGGPHLIS